jgi:mRNA-degrading endonuclease RelE of RelBE toxin-antitoxin system
MKHTIKLFIHDSFFDAFSVLPKKIQKKTREFMKKFKEDPNSSAINYEKINTFKDQSLRTVRVDQKYRAIIQAPSEGEGYHLLWVDNHDEAMNWATNKVFEWNRETQSFQMYEKPEKRPISKEAIVVEEHRLLYKDYSDLQLEKIGVPTALIDMVRELSHLEQLESQAEFLPTDAYEYLYYLTEGIGIDEILAEIEAGKTAEADVISSNAQKTVYMLTDDSELEDILSGDFDKWKIFLHPSQRSIAFGDFKGPMKVTGGAGTGKTVCAVHRAKYLTNKLTVVDKPVLFTTYTKSLTKYIVDVTNRFGISNEELIIKNIDSIIFETAKSEGVISSSSGLLNSTQELELWKEIIEYNPSRFDERFLFEEYNEIILGNAVEDVNQYYKTSRTGRSVRIGRQDKKLIWDLSEEFKIAREGSYTKMELCNLLIEHYRSGGVQPFSHIICDEIQDFSIPELSLLRSLVPDKENDLFLVGDPFQNIYGRRINFSKSGINIRGRRSRKLKVNYRTTEEIKKRAVSMLVGEHFDDFDGEEESTNGYVSLMHGQNPQYNVFDSFEMEESFISDKINTLLQNGQVKPSEICIASRTNKQIDDIKRMLNSLGLKYADIQSTRKNMDSIVVSTFHNLKGHEFKHLFVKGFDRDRVPFKHPEYDSYTDVQLKDYLKQEKSLYYVVFSRAIQTLIVTGVGEKSDWMESA